MKYYIKYQEQFVTSNFKLDSCKEHKANFATYDDAEKFLASKLGDDFWSKDYQIFDSDDSLVFVDKSESGIALKRVDVDSILTDLHSLSNSLRARSYYLKCRLSEVDKEVVDIYHSIEDSNFNVCDGYKMYKLLRETLRERRDIKNELGDITDILNRRMEDVKSMQSVILDRRKKLYNQRSTKYKNGVKL